MIDTPIGGTIESIEVTVIEDLAGWESTEQPT